MQLYWSPDSANLAIRIALEVLDLPYEGVRVNRGQDQHKAADYMTLNPQGLIPAMTDGDVTLFETGAILWHVVEKAGRLGPGGPRADDPVARAAALKWLFYLSNTVHADLRVAFYTHRYVQSDGAMAELRQGLATRLARHCDLMEAEITKGGLLGADVTVPDIYLCVALRWALLYPGPPLLPGLDQWPRVAALARRIEDLPGAQRAFMAESIPPARALTVPQRPDLPKSEVTGVI